MGTLYAYWLLVEAIDLVAQTLFSEKKGFYEDLAN